MAKKVAIGLDYGTNSVRALVVDIINGDELGTAIAPYPSGTEGVIMDARDPNLARQNPADYIACLETVIQEAMVLAGVSADHVAGIGVDATASTPIPLGVDNRPLSEDRRFAENPAALAWLWKDHTGYEEAAEISARGGDYLSPYGGAYSSEWFWSKIFRCAKSAPEVSAAASTWVEQSDFIPGCLTGTLGSRLKRNACAAGHKDLYHPEWGGYPPADRLRSLHPELARIRETLPDSVYTADQVAGGLTTEMASMTGLREGTPVAVGMIDAHAGAIGSGIRPGRLVKAMGTSTCDIMLGHFDLGGIPGIAGVVPNSVIPGFAGIEAGQAAVGDLFNWFVHSFAPEGHAQLQAEAARLQAGESGLLALDWNNGNRSLLMDPLLSGAIIGMSLHTTKAEVYRALVEATAFGALKIVRRLQEHGVLVEEVVACGGIAEKSPLTMQIYADVCNMPIRVARSSQAAALGAAICGATAASEYASLPEAISAMAGLKDVVYEPQVDSARIYQELYEMYCELHDSFGSGTLMKDLIKLRNTVRS